MRTMISQNTMRMLATVALIATAATVISCNKHLPDPALPQGTAIQFTTEDNWTKAIADESTLESEGFRVWGWFKGTTEGHIFYTNKTDDGTHVTDSNGEWTYDPENPRYWMNGTYDFFAVYPNAIAANVTHANDAFTFAYTLPSNANEQVDILVASSPDIDGSDSSVHESGVNLRFEHALCQLSFEATATKSKDEEQSNTNDNLKAIIYGIDIYARESGSYSSVTEEWVSSGTIENIYSVKGNDNLIMGEWTTLESGIIMLPQNLSGARLEVRYYGEREDKTLGVCTYKHFFDSNANWEKAQKIKYQIEIARNGAILFTPVVTPWVNASGGSFIVNTPGTATN